MVARTDTRTIQTGRFLGIVNQGNVGGDLVQNLIVPDRPTIRLTLPQEGLPKEADFLRLLSWRTSIARLVGRDRELLDLRDWAEDGGAATVRGRLLSGPGGSGKSRLAFELARALENTEEWTAGFVQPDQNADIEQADR